MRECQSRSLQNKYAVVKKTSIYWANRINYNQERPHSSLKCLTFKEFTEKAAIKMTKRCRNLSL